MTAVRIYTRPPIAGSTKSRLAASIGAERAAALHRAFLDDAILHALALPGSEVCLDATEDHPLLRTIAEERGIGMRIQRDGDLGERMAASIDDALRAHPRVLLVGSDAPLLLPSALRAAELALSEPGASDAVFAPTPDGGYALLGARVPLRLPGVRWSSRFALRDSEDALRRQGLVTARLAPTLDVDVADDLHALRAALGTEPRLAPHTARALAEPAKHL